MTGSEQTRNNDDIAERAAAHQLSVTKPSACSRCNGTGWEYDAQTCGDCCGLGVDCVDWANAIAYERTRLVEVTQERDQARQVIGDENELRVAHDLGMTLGEFPQLWLDEQQKRLAAERVAADLRTAIEQVIPQLTPADRSRVRAVLTGTGEGHNDE